MNNSSLKQVMQDGEDYRYWVIYISTKSELLNIQKDIDKIFCDYSFYPEIDWARYGYRPPDGYQVIGAWRHPQRRIVAFLFDNPYMMAPKPTMQLILYVAGNDVEIKSVESKVEILKKNFALNEQRTKIDSAIGERLDRVHKNKSFAIITTILGIFTVVINAFSLYLRKLPPPVLNSQSLITFYNTVIALVHFSALTLLLVVIIICAIFLIKYGILLLRRL